jgi:hypothetical protein
MITPVGARVLCSTPPSGSTAGIVAQGSFTPKTNTQFWYYATQGIRSVTGPTSATLRANGTVVARAYGFANQAGGGVTFPYGPGVGVTHFPAGVPVSWEINNDGNIFSDPNTNVCAFVLEL